MFVNPGAFDFHLKNHSVVRKIKFIPFDYSKAGVYGAEEWKKLAGFDKELEKKFDNIVNQSKAKRNIY